MFEKILINKYYFLIFILFLFTACGDSQNSQVAIAGVSTENIEINSNEQEILNAINKARSIQRDCYPNDSTKGVVGPSRPLSWNTQLYAAALEHSTDLATSNTFSHNGSGTSSDITGNGTPSQFFERIVANGYSNYYAVGENIAGGQQTLEEVMAAWLASPGHCENIMSNNYTEVGVAIVQNSNSTYGIYWAQEFGSKRQ